MLSRREEEAVGPFPRQPMYLAPFTAGWIPYTGESRSQLEIYILVLHHTQKESLGTQLIVKNLLCLS